MNPVILTCLVASCVLIRSIAEEAFRLASSSLAALAARSKPSGSNPVTVLPPREDGAFSGVITWDNDCSFFFFPIPPNILKLFQT